MKIRRLVIENVRNIDRAEFEDLGSIVVIVGPNGSGKTSLLEAIKIFKMAYGMYSPQFGINWANKYPEFVTLGRDNSVIEIEIELNNAEKEFIGSTTHILRGKVTVDRTMNVRTNGTDRSLLHKLFSKDIREDKRLGKIDYIPSDRRFVKGPIPSVSFDRNYIERDWHKMLGDTTQKFDSLKSDLWRMNYVDMEATINDFKPHPHYIDGIKNAFQNLLGDIKFIGVSGGLNEPPKFIVETHRGQHEIDLLSSGQAEILMIFSYLERRKFANSVIMFDGPERYLNAAIEKKIVGYFRRLAELGNQFWITTHSPEIINSCDEETIYRLSGGSPNIAERVDTKSERIKTLEALGATLFVQLISRRVVYVEGESDEKILTYFEPNIIDNVSFIQSMGVKPLVKVVELLNKATRFENFRAIRDRNTFTDKQIEEFEKKSKNRLIIWKRHEIENYLLDADVLFDVLQEHHSIKCKTTFKDSIQLKNELKRTATDLKNLVIAKRLESKINNEFFKRIKLDPKNIEESLSSFFTRRLSKFKELDEDKLNEFREKIQKEVKSKWDQEWINLCPGKDVLKLFCKRHIKGSLKTLLPILIEFVAKDIAQQKRIHPDVKSAISILMN